MSLIKKTIISSVALSLLSIGAVAQTAKDKLEDAIIQYARSNGVLAGNARYCKAKNDLVEEFIAKTNAQIVFMARDDKYQEVLGRLEFKNILTASSVKQPKESCDSIIRKFETVLRESR